MKNFLFVLCLFCALVSKGATPGEFTVVETLTGTNVTANWNRLDKSWLLSGDSSVTLGAYPYAANTEANFTIKIIQPAAQNYTVIIPGVQWLSADLSSIPQDSTNRIVIQHLNGTVSATWVESTEIWENVSGVIQVRTAQLPELFFLQSTAADNPLNVILATDTTVPWTVGSLAEFRNNGTLAGSIAAVSGYTGGGTLYLSDDGTYKPATGGSNLWAYTLGLLYPSPAVDLVAIDSQLADASTNVALLVTSVNTWTGGELIKAVNNGDTMFSVSGVSGYTGAGTLFLSDDGTYKAASGGGGDSIWTNILGVIQPIGTGLTNILSFTSGLADNSTNVALVVDSASAWTGGKLADFRNASTSQSFINSFGGFRSFHDYGGGTNYDTVTFQGSGAGTILNMESSDGIDLADLFIQFGGNGTGSIDVYSGLGYTTVMSLNPFVASTGSAAAYLFDTSQVLTNGDQLISASNAGTPQIRILSQGQILIGSQAPIPVGPSGLTFHSVRSISDGDPETGAILTEVYDDFTAPTNIVTAYLKANLIGGTPAGTVYTDATVDNYSTYLFGSLDVSPTDISFALGSEGPNYTVLWPTRASTGSSIAYLFDTSNVLTNGDKLVSIANAGSEFAYFGAEKTFVLNDGPSDYFDLRASSTDGPHMIMWAAGNPAVELFPDVASDYTPFNFQAIQNLTANTSPLFAIGQFGTNQFTLKANSGYTDSGTKVLYDDGTYKEFSNGTNTVVQQLGPGTVTYIPKWNTTNTLNDTIAFQTGVTNITVGGTFSIGSLTNLFIASGKDVHYTNSGAGSATTYFKVANTVGNASFGVASGGNAVVLAGPGLSVHLAGNNGSDNVFVDSNGMYPGSNGALNLGGGNNQWNDFFLDSGIVQNGSTNSIGIFHGSGTPEGALSKNPGSIYSDWVNGELYKKTSGTGNTGWTILSSGGGGGAPVGTVVNSGTPVLGNVPFYSDTTGTNVAPSGALTLSASTNMTVKGGITVDNLVVTNAITAGSVTIGSTNVVGALAGKLDSTFISDTAFASSWNGVTTIAPSKNAVYDWGHTFDTDDDGKVNVLDMGAGIVKTDSGGAVSAATLNTDYSLVKTLAHFTPRDNQPPAAAFATLDTRNSIAVLDFDDTAEEAAIFVSVIPDYANLASGITVRLATAATTATSGNMRWGASFMRMASGGSDIDTDDFDTATEVTTATSGTSGVVTVVTITCTTIDSVVAGDAFRLKVYRDATDGADTVAGDLELISVELVAAF